MLCGQSGSGRLYVIVHPCLSLSPTSFPCWIERGEEHVADVYHPWMAQLGSLVPLKTPTNHQFLCGGDEELDLGLLSIRCCCAPVDIAVERRTIKRRVNWLPCANHLDVAEEPVPLDAYDLAVVCRSAPEEPQTTPSGCSAPIANAEELSTFDDVIWLLCTNHRMTE
jgi:hypothetical protein